MPLKYFVAINRAGARWLEKTFPRSFDGPDYVALLQSSILSAMTKTPSPTVLEIGGIDRPLLHKSSTFTYIGLDIEDRAACYDVYDRFIVQSVEASIDARADVVVSTTVMEHVPDTVAAVRSMYDALRPGGLTLHYIPSKWHPYSIILRLVGPKLQRVLIDILRPEAKTTTGYPTFFAHCSPHQMSRVFSDQGFLRVDIRPFYRANDYFAFFLPAYLVVSLFENVCRISGIRICCSGFIVSAQKPSEIERNETAYDSASTGQVSPRGYARG